MDFDLDRTGIANFTAEIYTAATLGGAGTLITTLTASNGTISYTFTPATTPTTQNYVFVYFKKLSTGNKTFFIDKLQIRSAASSPYAAVVVMTSDYYPFGYQMPGRHTNDDKYRFGYNGMEKDKEMHGEGNSYTTEFRQYDPRLGRWLSLDPLKAKYPWMSPYVAFNDNPVYFVDPLGLEGDEPKGGGGDFTRMPQERRLPNNFRDMQFVRENPLSNFLQKVGSFLLKAGKAIGPPQRIYTKVSQEQHEKWMSQGRVGHYNESSTRPVEPNNGQYFLHNGQNKERLGTGNSLRNYGAPLMYQVEGQETVTSQGQTHQQVFLLEPVRMKKRIPTDDSFKSESSEMRSIQTVKRKSLEIQNEINQKINDLISQGYKPEDIDIKFYYAHNFIQGNIPTNQFNLFLNEVYGESISIFNQLTFNNGLRNGGGNFISGGSNTGTTLFVSYEIIVTKSTEEYSYE